MIVLDTNVLSALMRPALDEAISRWFAGLGLQSLAVTTVTFVEVVRGIERLPQGRRREEISTRFGELVAPDSRLVVFGLDETAARLAGALMARRDAQGRPVSDADMMIAGIVAANGAALATRNTRDFEGLGLSLIDPWSGDS